MKGEGLSGPGQRTAWAEAGSLSLSLWGMSVSLHAYSREKAKSTSNPCPGDNLFLLDFQLTTPPQSPLILPRKIIPGQHGKAILF